MDDVVGQLSERQKNGLMIAAAGFAVILAGWKYYLPEVKTNRIIVALAITATGGAIMTTGLQRYSGVLE